MNVRRWNDDREDEDTPSVLAEVLAPCDTAIHGSARKGYISILIRLRSGE